MTQEKVKDLVERLGLKAEELSDEVIAKIESYKDSLDKETRRQCRIYWSVISAICLVAGFAAGLQF